MKSFTSISLVSAFVSAALAQYTIDPNSVSNGTRSAWCTQQEAECPLICLDTAANSAATDSNTCDPNSLTYSCVCANGFSPNVSEYSQTLPYYICQEWGNQCVSNCGNDNSCQSACRDDHPCGALNPTRQNTSTLTTSTSAATGSASGTNAPAGSTTGDFTGFASGGSPTSTGGGSGSSGTTSAKSGASSINAVRVWALSAGQTFGTLAILGALFGGFAVLL